MGKSKVNVCVGFTAVCREVHEKQLSEMRQGHRLPQAREQVTLSFRGVVR